MTTAAIYARKSTEQNGIADEGKSVTRPFEHARAYATAKVAKLEFAARSLDAPVLGR